MHHPCFTALGQIYMQLLDLNFYSTPHRYDFLKLNIQNKNYSLKGYLVN